MPLQNRVEPFGTIRADPSRGLFTGNRGIIHEPETRTLLKRRWTTRAWIICTCDFRGRRREVMGRNGTNGSAGWTELFFLDEVTALAAGHRPCFYCRREQATAFAAPWANGQGRQRFRAPEIDAVLHGERLATGSKALPLDATAVAALPDGTMISAAGRPFALKAGRAMPWRFEGYGLAVERSMLRGPLSLITPSSTVAALRAGFSPVWHPTAMGPE
jgi:hypothetical protein